MATPTTEKRPSDEGRTRPTARAEAAVRTLAIDIGGTGIKMLPIDGEGNALAARARELTPHPSPPEAVMGVIREMLAQQAPFDRVSVGYRSSQGICYLGFRFPRGS